MSLSADGGYPNLSPSKNGETKALNFGTGLFFSEAISETYVLEVPTIYDVYVMTMEGDIARFLWLQKWYSTFSGSVPNLLKK